MKIIVIGSEGFIGSNSFKYFSERGEEVFGCDIINRPDANKDLYFHIDAANPNYDKLFKLNKFDVCLNASGSANVAYSFNNIHEDFNLNTNNVFLILESIRQFNPTCRFINFSSAAVYGNPTALPVRESSAIAPISPYGYHKYESEQICQEFYKMHKIPTCSLRVFSAYGNGLKKQIFWDIYQKSKLGKTIELFGTGDETRDFIFIEDLMQALHKIIKSDSFNGAVINVSSGIETTIHEAANKFISYFGNDFHILFNGNEKPGDPKNWKADISKLLSYGYLPEFNITDGLKQYYLWLKKTAL